MLDGDVLVEVIGSGELSDGEKVVNKAQGKLYTKAGGRFLVYHIADENNPKFIVRHILKLTASSISVSRSCAANKSIDTRFVLEAGKAVPTAYNTPFGTMELVFDTKLLSITEKEDSMYIKAKYNIKMGNEIASRNVLEIKIS